ncbi:ribose import ATP-binding protein RbsA [Christensenellaceae bacterium]|nr:ribose import ATP-binding protein RbsA [Christensenellaceae bacterium]BDF60191.1 ribose import ATP-binding protein RbsA [Christensenellaceae bacterium]
METMLEMKGIEKAFDGTTVLNNVNFQLQKGEVHALCGGNGAGKSTLMKILTGVYPMDAGCIRIAGKEVEIKTPHDSEKNGVSMIFQEFSLVPSMTVSQNLFLNREHTKGGMMVDDKRCIEEAAQMFQKLNVEIDPTALVETLSVGYMQMVEIAKALLAKNTQILIMDEPTASLSDSETEALFTLIGNLKKSGISIIYISHRLSEIFKICDRISVLKDGRSVLTKKSEDLTMDQVIKSMVGTEVDNFIYIKRDQPRGKSPVFEVKNLTMGTAIRDVSFDIYPGEIVGLAGLMGSGRTEIARCLFGIDTPDTAEIYVDGKRVTIHNPQQAMQNGVALVPENRRTQGLVIDHSVKDNVILPQIDNLTTGLVVSERQSNQLVETYIKRLNIKTDSMNTVVRLLSGGNQQKIVLAKWLARHPKVLILDEPTIGVDIGAKGEIIGIMREMVTDGAGILVISSEFEELIAVSDRLLILNNGKITGEMQREEINSEEELHYAIQGS